MHLTIPRRAYTLLEIFIACSITGVLTTAIIASWTAQIEFSYTTNEDLNALEKIDAIKQHVLNECDSSGLFYSFDNATQCAATPTPLYPMILQSGLELRYVRFRNTLTTTSVPVVGSVNLYENFLNTNSYHLSDITSCPPSPYFIINTSPKAGKPGFWNVSPIWDTPRNNLTFSQNADPANLRIFRYILIPANVTTVSHASSATWAPSVFPFYPQAGANMRRGILLHQYMNPGTNTFTTISILADNVVFAGSNADVPYPTAGSPPCFQITTAFDNPAAIGPDSIKATEVRVKMSITKGIKNRNNLVILNVKFFANIHLCDYGT